MSLLDRFCRYTQVETTANDETRDYPSSPGQRELGRMLADELRQIGLADARQDEHGLVWADIPPTADGAPTIAWLAHLDTSPEYTARAVKPVVQRDYAGGDIVLPGDPSKVLRAADTPELAELKGKTLITTDGTTLLGADDKAGVAVIVTAAERLLKQRSVRHGRIRVIFTCDEEIGRGCEKLDVAQIGAACAYTLDGEGAGLIENETFSADLATVTITGRNTHPGYATGKLLSAIRLAALFVGRMPWQTRAPETTAGRDGFLHPYTIEGGVAQTRLKIILRSFQTRELEEQAAILRNIAATITAEHRHAQIDVDIRPQYRNMAEYLTREPRAVDLAAAAYRKLGIEPTFKAIRGGTDGSRLSEMGLPTPNLSAGMHNFHSPLEFACLEQMEAAVDLLIELAGLWGAERARAGRAGE